MASKIVSEFEVKNQMGLHVRPATMFVKTAARFSACVHVEKEGEVVNGKSMMSLLMLSAGQGAVLRIIVEGDDAQEAMAAIAELFASKFNEP